MGNRSGLDGKDLVDDVKNRNLLLRSKSENTEAYLRKGESKSLVNELARWEMEEVGSNLDSDH